MSEPDRRLRRDGESPTPQQSPPPRREHALSMRAIASRGRLGDLSIEAVGHQLRQTQPRLLGQRKVRPLQRVPRRRRSRHQTLRGQHPDLHRHSSPVCPTIMQQPNRPPSQHCAAASDSHASASLCLHSASGPTARPESIRSGAGPQETASASQRNSGPCSRRSPIVAPTPIATITGESSRSPRSALAPTNGRNGVLATHSAYPACVPRFRAS